jgi:O-antigen/teichoic acid export membrane protein
MVIYIEFVGIPVDFSVGSFLLLLSFHLLFTYLNVYLISLLNLLYYRTSFIVLTLLTAIGVLTFSSLFVYFLGESAENWLYGLVLSNMLFTMVAYTVFKKKIGSPSSDWYNSLMQFDVKSFSSIVSFVVPLALASIFMWSQQSGYRIIIEENIGLSFLGFLGIGLLVATQVSSVIESIMLQYFYPIYYQEISNTTVTNRTKAINNFINKALPIYFLLTLFVTFLAKYLVEVLVDEKFFEAYIFTVFGIWIEFFRMSSNLFGNVGQSEMQTKKLLIPYAFGSMVTMVLVYFATLSAQYQLYIPMALVIGSFSTMFFMYIEMQKLLRFTIDYKLLLFSLLLSLPFVGVWYIDIGHSSVLSFFILLVYGLYFLGAILVIYLRGIKTLPPMEDNFSVKLLMWI